MKKRLFSIFTALIMALTCFVAVPEMGFAVENTDATAVEEEAVSTAAAAETYTGGFPELGHAIDQKAIFLSWGKGTSSALYTRNKGGHAKSQFTKAINKVYPSRSKWSAQCQDGASCDVSAGTIIRASYDDDMPRGYDEQVPYMNAHPELWTKLNADPKAPPAASALQGGDVITWETDTNSMRHICIVVVIDGKKYISEASHSQTTFAHITDTVSSQLRTTTTSPQRKVTVYRAADTSKTVGKGPLIRGSASDEVEKLQKFLNWAGYDCGTADGSFGANTERAVCAFQANHNLTVDGEFGSKSLEEAEKATKNEGAAFFKTYSATYSEPNPDPALSPVAAPVVKKAYTGKWPTKTVSKKKGSKTQKKRWQAFLKWYGYPVKVDGKFGSSTVKYTKQFQKAMGLKADGSVGKKTLKKAKAVKK